MRRLVAGAKYLPVSGQGHALHLQPENSGPGTRLFCVRGCVSVRSLVCFLLSCIHILCTLLLSEIIEKIMRVILIIIDRWGLKEYNDRSVKKQEENSDD